MKPPPGPYNAGGDCCLSIWATAYASGVPVFVEGARVLEIGCAEADWITPMLDIRPDLQITGIDWRGVNRPPGTFVQGDVLTHDFEPESFDAIVGVSSIEHIGLGHYDHDPLDEDGDVHCMARARRWLKPGGWVYLDVPFDPAGYYLEGTSHRVYDEAALARRLLSGLTERYRWLVSLDGRDASVVAVYATKDA